MKSHIIWLLHDGKPGHENQSLGLAEAMARQIPCVIHPISIAGKSGWLHRIKAALGASAGLPKPDVIIAAGHATHFTLLWLTRKHHARSIVLMHPSLPMSWFNLCIAPAHDFPKPSKRDNLIITQGALNRISANTSAEKTGRLILIGGPSGNHGWDSKSLLPALTEITSDGTWLLTDSRRTPVGFLDEIRKLLPAVEVIPYQDTPPNWLPAKLSATKEVWVTEDSISMIYEALSSGANVGLLPMPRNHDNSRVLRGLKQLIGEGFLTPFAEWQKTRQIKKPPCILRETDRCAEVVILKLSL